MGRTQWYIWHKALYVKKAQNIKHSQFSLFAVTFYRVTVNSELVDCKLMLLWFLWASGHTFINWWIRHLVFCVFLFKDTFLIYIVASFTWNSWPTAPSFVAEGSSSNTRIFSTSHITASLRLGTLDSITHYAWKAFWTIKPSTKITQKHKICGTNRLHKGHRFIVCAEVRRQTVTLLDLIEYALGNSNFPPFYE